MSSFSSSVHSLTHREEEFRKYLFSQTTWPPDVSPGRCATSLMSSTPQSSDPAPPGRSESFCSFPHLLRYLQRFPFTVDYLLAVSCKLLNWLGTFNFLVQDEDTGLHLSSVLWTCSLQVQPRGGDLTIPEHAPISAGTFCALLLPETLWSSSHWPTFSKAERKNNGIIYKVLRTCVGRLAQQATRTKCLLCARLLLELLVLDRSKIIIMITWTL